MTTAVRELLVAFDALSEREQHDALTVLLSRSETGGLSDEALTELADGLFQELDQAEADCAEGQSG